MSEQGNNISIFYTPTTIKEFEHRSKEIFITEPVVVTLGCTAKASSRAELKELLCKSLTRGLGLMDAQKKNYCMDGKNGSRVAKLITSLI